MNFCEVSKVSESIVQKAGRIAKEMSARSKILRHKEDGDIVTDGDLAVQTFVISSLKETFPNHGITSEELDEPYKPDAEFLWILDPIDGTKYYARGVPLYTVSLALKHRDEIVLGFVYSPDWNKMYSACKDEGAMENGKRMSCSSVRNLNEASICLEIPSRDSQESSLKQAIEKMFRLVKRSYRVRILGVSALGLCLCAGRGFDAYVNLKGLPKEHDIAAGQIIMHESGGELICRKMRDGHVRTVAGPSILCEEIFNVLTCDSDDV